MPHHYKDTSGGRALDQFCEKNGGSAYLIRLDISRMYHLQSIELRGRQTTFSSLVDNARRTKQSFGKEIAAFRAGDDIVNQSIDWVALPQDLCGYRWEESYGDVAGRRIW